MSTNLPDNLPEHIRRWLLQHVRLIPTENLPAPAGSRITPQGYEIALGKEYYNASEEQKQTLLLHEIGHILRGDCLRMEKNRNEASLWNIASDACINENLPHQHCLELKGVLYTPLATELNTEIPNILPTHYLPTTSVIFQALQKVQKECSCDVGTGCGQQGSDHIPDKAERAAHAAAVIDGRDIAAGMGIGNQTIQGHRKPLTLAPKKVSALEAILDVLKSKYEGRRRHTRTYRREGRIEGLRGSHYLPRQRVMVALDDSGSCVAIHPKIAAVAEYLKRRYEVIMVQFDTEARKVTHLQQPDGGGTMFQPVWKLANTERIDAVLMLTDGEAGDITPLPGCPVVWALVQENNMPMRPEDRKVVLEI